MMPPADPGAPTVLDPMAFRRGLRRMESAALYRLWRNLRGARLAPLRSELTAELLGPHSPHVGILESDGTGWLRFRVAGAVLARLVIGPEAHTIAPATSRRPGNEPPLLGAGLDAVAMFCTDDQSNALSTLMISLEGRAISIHGRATGNGGNDGAYEMLALPFRSEGGAIDRLLVGIWTEGLSERPERLPVRLIIEEMRATPAAGASVTPITTESRRQTLVPSPPGRQHGLLPVAGKQGVDHQRGPAPFRSHDSSSSANRVAPEAEPPSTASKVIQADFRTRKYRDQDNRSPGAEGAIARGSHLRLVVDNKTAPDDFHTPDGCGETES